MTCADRNQRNRGVADEVAQQKEDSSLTSIFLALLPLAVPPPVLSFSVELSMAERDPRKSSQCINALPNFPMAYINEGNKRITRPRLPASAAALRTAGCHDTRDVHAVDKKRKKVRGKRRSHLIIPLMKYYNGNGG